MVMQGRRSLPSSAAPGNAAALPPVASKAKDYTDRPEEVMAELDDLRTRSIAKVLNKHFTDTTKQLAKEKAQADAAIADLERRRAQTKEFIPSKSGELNPYDQLYMQLQQKRAECRRKEKETLMLYQRYVMKYGKSAKTTSPMKLAGADASSEGDAKATILDTLDENTEINFSEMTPKKAGGQSKEQLDEKQKQDAAATVDHFVSALNRFMTDDQANNTLEKDDVSDDYLGTDQTFESFHGAVASPTHRPQSKENDTVLSPAPEVKMFLSAMSNFMAVKQEVTAIDIEKDQDEPMIEEKEPTMVKKSVTVDEVLGSGSANMDPVTDTSVTTTEVGDVDLNDSDVILECAPVATLDSTHQKEEDVIAVNETKTPNNSNVERNVRNDEIQKEDLPMTPDRIVKEASATTTPTECTTPPTDVNHVETPSFAATTVDEDVDERSIISGLTSVNSALTRQVLDEVEEEMEDFIKTETEAIRKVLDSEEEHCASNYSSLGNSSPTLLSDESMRVAIKAEAMAREMQRILDEFSSKDAAVTASTGERGDERNNNDGGTTKYPYKFEPAIPGEDWYVYYDDNYKREFYLEKKSGQTQWDYPTSEPRSRMEQPISSNVFLSDIQSVASSSRGGSLSVRSSRRSLYRRQRKKRRTQRLLFSFFTLFCVLAAVFHWRIRYPEKSLSSAMVATLSSFTDSSFQDTIAFFKDQLEYTFTDRRRREEEEEKVKIFAKAQRERQARELAARNAKEEAARKAREEAERKAKEEADRKAKEEAERKAKEEAERKAREQAERKAKEEAERKAREEEARLEAERRLASEEQERIALAEKHERESRRPWGCNIPFAYVVPRCGRLAAVKPLFHESDFVFLQ